jgi:hypothetical protein
MGARKSKTRRWDAGQQWCRKEYPEETKSNKRDRDPNKHLPVTLKSAVFSGPVTLLP